MKSRMKIVISILVLCMAFALVGCGKNTTPDAQKPGSDKDNKKPDENLKSKITQLISMMVQSFNGNITMLEKISDIVG